MENFYAIWLPIIFIILSVVSFVIADFFQHSKAGVFLAIVSMIIVVLSPGYPLFTDSEYKDLLLFIAIGVSLFLVFFNKFRDKIKNKKIN